MSVVEASSRCVGIMQREWGVTNSTSETPCIGTSGVAGCIVMIVHLPACKEAALAHFDSQTATMENVNRIFHEMGKNPGILKVTFAGGWKDCHIHVNRFVVSLIPYLKETYGYIANTDLFFKKEINDGYGFVGIDTRSGKLIVTDNTQRGPKFSNFDDMELKVKALFSKYTPFGSFPLDDPVDVRGPLKIEINPEVVKDLIEMGILKGP